MQCSGFIKYGYCDFTWYEKNVVQQGTGYAVSPYLCTQHVLISIRPNIITPICTKSIRTPKNNKRNGTNYN